MLKPFYENSRVRVFCGNSLEVIAELKANGEKFDLLLTDPPYGMYADNLFVDDSAYIENVCVKIFNAAMEISPLGILTPGNRNIRLYPTPQEWGGAFCPSAASFNTWGHCDFQPILYYGKPHGNSGKYRKLSHLLNEHGFCKSHPCSKPLEFWKKLMLCGTDGIKEKRILDPFGGSGTTGRAAQDLCMKATLIELNPRYCELIAKNCSQETLF